MKKLFTVLFILALCQSAFAYDQYNGRVKYGDYKCYKDGETCEYRRMERSETYHGKACPKRDYQDRSKDAAFYNEMANFLNSQYCRFVPYNIKKYECKYNPGFATIYMENGKVIEASYDPKLPKKRLDEFYVPSMCKLVPMDKI